MLRQNWFCVENMIMFHEDICEQWFYDMNTNCIYVVGTENGNITITQFENGSDLYDEYYSEYIIYTTM